MEYNFESVPCNVCGADDFYKIAEKGQFGLPVHVGLCKACGLGYLNPRWDSKGYLNFYTHEYDTYYRPQIINTPLKEQKTTNPIIARIEALNAFPKHVSSILDIGSGEGANLSDLRNAFPDAKTYAIEPSLDSQKHLTSAGVSIISDDVNTDWESRHEASINLIVMRHVLEHFLDPLSILKKVYSALDQDGIAYIAVPNNLNPSQNLRDVWFRAVHVYYFNKLSLANMLAMAGLEPLTMIEGDEYNRGELVAIVKKATTPMSPTISKDHFEQQKAVFENRLKKEDNPVNKGIYTLKKLAQKMIS